MSQVSGQLPPQIVRNWIRNGALAGVVQAVAGLCIYAVRLAAGADETLGIAATIGVYLATIVIGLMSGAAEGVLSGAVLQRVVPALPARTWVALNAVLTAALLLFASMMTGASTREGPSVDDVPLAAFVMVGFLMGSILAAVVATFQALVLHRVAFGTAAWIAYSAIAGGVVYSLAFVVSLASDSADGFAGELTQQLIWLALTVVQVLIMLPGLAMLRPRAVPQDVF